MRSPVTPGDIVGGKYRVDRIVGAGGMGVVVAATHTELDQPVALKFISPDAVSGKDAVERFMREARAVAKLKSEHVARVYDVGRDARNNPYMVLELLEGVDLAKLVKQKGPLPVADSVEFVLQACEALVEAHAAGIVHRDLKPQNLFVGRRLNGMPLVKVLDFGIAKAFGAAAVGQMALTDSQAVIGSPLYMAPEHMRSARAADVRSDIWSLGVILYELLGGQLPFDGETVTEVCIRVVNETPPSLLSLRPALDPTLVSIVMRCLEKDPNARWQNVAQLATALEPFSRSAQHGGALRPWRSFEDTMDSNPVAGGSASTDAPPDAGVANTVPSDGSGEQVKAAMGAPGAAAPATLRVSAPPQLASTDTAWGRDRAPHGAKRSPAFTVGLVVGVVASAAAAAAIVLALRGESTTDVSTAAATTTTAAAATPPPPAPVESAVVVVADPPPVDTTVSPAALPNAPAAAPSGRTRVPSPTGRARSDQTKAPATPASTATTTASTSAVRQAEAPAPNGAPILR